MDETAISFAALDHQTYGKDIDMPIDLSGGGIQEAITDAAVRGHTVAWAYLDDDGWASLSFRGSTVVLGPTQLGVWARKRDEGLAAAVAARPQVTALYFEHGGPGPVLLTIKGLAHVDESVNDTVYSSMPEMERTQDPEKLGVAVVVDVEKVFGFGAEGPFHQTK